MDEQPMPTGHLSIETAKKALKVTEISEKINLDFGEAFTNQSMGDYIFFILSNEDSICALGCHPDGYTLELEDDDGTQYYIIKNIYNLLRTLKKRGMSGYNPLGEDESSE